MAFEQIPNGFRKSNQIHSGTNGICNWENYSNWAAEFGAKWTAYLYEWMKFWLNNWPNIKINSFKNCQIQIDCYFKMNKYQIIQRHEETNQEIGTSSFNQAISANCRSGQSCYYCYAWTEQNHTWAEHFKQNEIKNIWSLNMGNWDKRSNYTINMVENA